MSRNKIGRNDACPCGSGKKYKRCCGRAGTSRVSETMEDLEKALSEQDFATTDEVQAFVFAYQQRVNTTGRDDFDGLSPAQMAALLYSPMASPDTLAFAQSGIAAAHTPVMVLFNTMAEAIGEAGVKTTAKGNLPRALCHSAYNAYPGVVTNDPMADLISVNREDDFQALHVTRLVARMAGLIRKYKGRFLLTRKAERLRVQNGTYPLLLEAFAAQFNWAYSDGYPDLPIVQHAFAFSLYLIHRHGDTPHTEDFYEDAFLRAFPMAFDDVEPRPYASAETTLRRCYTLRTLIRFAAFFGLVDIVQISMGLGEPRYRVTKTPLFSDVIQFHLD